MTKNPIPEERLEAIRKMLKDEDSSWASTLLGLLFPIPPRTNAEKVAGFKLVMQEWNPSFMPELHRKITEALK